MRNLKRVLSLALASAMLLGMMVIGAGAADKKASDLTDMDKVTNKEAVNLMVDLGIIVGKPDGSFAPTEAVDRATMAKLICFVLMGDTDPALFEGTTTDLKDIESNWAKGYIKYCYANKIISGDGMGSFFPANGVTVVQAAKMLLVALNYDATAEKYEKDSSWSVNIMRDAKTAGLLNNVNASTNDALTREGAAQMIFNALFAKTVKYETQYDQGVAYKANRTTTSTTLGSIQYDLVKLTALVENINSKGMLKLGTPSPANTNAPSYVDEKLPGTPDMVGSVVSIYVKATKDGDGKLVVSKLYSTAASLSAANVVATNYGLKNTSTIAPVTGKAALTALLVTDSTKVASLESGKSVDDLVLYYNGAKDTAKANLSKIGAYGVVTEFKNTDDNAGVDTVVITEKKVATLSTAPVISGDTVTISSLGLAKADTSKVVGYADLKKDDVVLYVQMGGMTYIEKAEMVEGTPAGAHNTKGMLLDGTYYLTSGLTGASNEWTGTEDYTNTYKFYVDNGKNVVKAVKVTDEATAGSYAVLADIALVTTTGVNGTHYVEGKLVKTDGSVEVVKIATINGASVVLAGDTKAVAANLWNWSGSTAEASTGTYDNATFYYTKATTPSVKYTAKYFAATATASLTGNSIGMNAAGDTAATAAYAKVGQVYEYTVNSDGNYVLTTSLSSKATYGQLTAGPISNNKAVFNGTANIGNSSTIFLYETVDGNGNPVYTVYTGIANAPSTNGNILNASTNAIVKNASGVAVFVYAKVAGTTLSSSDYVYIYDIDNYTTAKNGSTTYYILDAVVNGVNESVKLAAVPGAVGLYPIKSINDKDIKTLDTAVTTKYTGVISASGGALVTDVTDKKAFTYNDDTQIVYVDSKNNSSTVAGESLSINAYDTVYVIETAAASGIAKVVYVVYQAPSVNVLTLTASSANGASSVPDGDLADGKGAITVGTDANKVKISAATEKTSTEIKSISINDVEVAVGTDFPVVKGVTTLTVKVLVKDLVSNAEDVITATVAVTNNLG